MPMNISDISDLLSLCDQVEAKLRTYDSNGQASNLFDLFRQLTSPLIDGNALTPEIKGSVPAKNLSHLQASIFSLNRRSTLIGGRGVSDHLPSVQMIRNSLNALKNTIESQESAKERKIFYSWQSTLPNSDNRGLIFDCLEKAISKINIEIDQPERESIEIDHDTKGHPGSPKIFETIKNKIRRSGIFVADVSLVAGKQSNSNVMVELGYALSLLGENRVIMIFNEAYGETRDAPFDLGFSRMVTYNFKKNSELSNRLEQKSMLESKISSAVKAILGIS